VNKYEIEVLEIKGEKIETWKFKINTDNKDSVKLLKEIVDYINGTNLKLVIDPIDEVFSNIYLYPQDIFTPIDRDFFIERINKIVE
jgi:hypothetical protein